jgi:hypothetical protein
MRPEGACGKAKLGRLTEQESTTWESVVEPLRVFP